MNDKTNTATITRWLTPPEVAGILRTTTGHLANLRWQGRGPAYVKVDGARVIYTAAAVEAYQQRQMSRSGVTA